MKVKFSNSFDNDDDDDNNNINDGDDDDNNMHGDDGDKNDIFTMIIYSGNGEGDMKDDDGSLSGLNF